MEKHTHLCVPIHTSPDHFVRFTHFYENAAKQRIVDECGRRVGVDLGAECEESTWCVFIETFVD